MFFPTVALVYFTILSYLQFPRTAFSLTQRCPWHYSAWLSAVPDITQLDSMLSRTAFSLTQSSPWSYSAWLSAVPDTFSLTQRCPWYYSASLGQSLGCCYCLYKHFLNKAIHCRIRIWLYLGGHEIFFIFSHTKNFHKISPVTKILVSKYLLKQAYIVWSPSSK